MKFYGRQAEIQQIQTITKQSKDNGKMTVITGRRRVGKTLLSLEASHTEKVLYLFIAKKTEALICQECIEVIQNNFDTPVIGDITRFRDVFKLLMELAKTQHFVLIIDEFQEFLRINPAVYSELQNLWDQYKRQSKVHLMFIGSIYSLMVKIFQNNKEPLFGRADRIIYLKPFQPETIRQIQQDEGHYTVENFFFAYLFTGGIPRYLEILIDNECFERETIIDFILSKNSPFLSEGRHLLIEEFGKDYGTYFSILELIATGKTGRGEIESILGINTGGYLQRLSETYDVIEIHRPINAKPNGKLQKYLIKDNFLNFWFRFIYRHTSAIEADNFTYVKRILERDLSSFSGLILERLFQSLLANTGDYNMIGNYWERGNQNEIDIVAVNDWDKSVLVAEVKLNASRIRMGKLKEKTAKLKQHYPKHNFQYRALSLENLDDTPPLLPQ
uniref:Archaeal ATPase, fused to C-terminal DUF234 domain n=1 Tax=uncultured Thiotrichaceae bacterium TaxID=298394 RepID=A0A6S6UGV4_9GAMM|nr:MAG: archaeal ATPase, fused to C-terminal DUF234 domain [uncultured Thiotrichaceae bacterium]